MLTIISIRRENKGFNLLMHRIVTYMIFRERFMTHKLHEFSTCSPAHEQKYPKTVFYDYRVYIVRAATFVG